MQVLNVEKDYDGKSLNSYLLYKFPYLKQSTLYKALRKKDIRINGIRVNNNVIIHFSDEVKVFISDEFLFTPDIFSSSHDTNMVLDIVFEDDNILVINKPTGIEVTGSNSLTTKCEKYVQGFVKPCHRLDRNTSRTCSYGKKWESPSNFTWEV